MNVGTQRFRLAYSKLGKVRFLGHRDVARMWERTLRRAEVPVAMSAGFTPRARIAFGLALPTGAESLIELLDVLVELPVDHADRSDSDIEHWRLQIDGALPEGFRLSHFEEIESHDISLQESVTASSWLLLLDHDRVEEAVERVRCATSVLLERERKGEMHLDDIRPGILDIDIVEPGQLQWLADIWPGDPLGSRSTPVVEALLTTSGRGIRPTELVKALCPEGDPWDHLTRVLRTQQWIEKNGQRMNVLNTSVAPPRVSA